MPHHSDDELEDLRRIATDKLKAKTEKHEGEKGSRKEKEKVSKLQRQPKSKGTAIQTEEEGGDRQEKETATEQAEVVDVEEEEEVMEIARDDVAEYEDELDAMREKVTKEKKSSKKSKKAEKRSPSQEKVEESSKRSSSPSPKPNRKEKARSRSKHKKDKTSSSSKKEKHKPTSRSGSREQTKTKASKRERSKSPRKESKRVNNKSTRERSASRERHRQRSRSRNREKDRRTTARRDGSRERNSKHSPRRRSRSRANKQLRLNSTKKDEEEKTKKEEKDTNGESAVPAEPAKEGENEEKEKEATKEEERKERKRTRKSGWDDRSQVPVVPAPVGGTPLSMQQLIQAQIQARAAQVSQLQQQKLLALKTAQQETAAKLKQQEVVLANHLLQASLLQQQQQQQQPAVDPIAEQKAIIERRVYVGSLSYDLTEDHIRAPFAACGNIVKIDMPREAGLGRSKGFCFVEYDSKQAADTAFATMNGIMLGGRPIKVGKPSSANAGVAPILPPTVASGMQGGLLQPGAVAAPAQLNHLQRLALLGLLSGSNPNQAALIQLAQQQQPAQVLPPIGLATPTALQAAAKNRIYVGSVLWDLTSDHLKAVFEAFGKVVAVELIPNPETGKHKGYGFVEFATEKSAEDAIANMDGFELCGRLLKVGRAQYSVTAKRPEVEGTGLLPVSSAPGLLPLPTELLATQSEGTAGASSPKGDLDSLEGNQTGHIDRFSLMKKLMASREGSNVVLLKNMISSEELDPGFEQEVREECETFGQVNKVVVHLAEDKAVHVFVQFAQAAQALKAKEALQKRWFGGRVIVAELFDQPAFEAGALA